MSRPCAISVLLLFSTDLLQHFQQSLQSEGNPNPFSSVSVTILPVGLGLTAVVVVDRGRDERSSNHTVISKLGEQAINLICVSCKQRVGADGFETVQLGELRAGEILVSIRASSRSAPARPRSHLSSEVATTGAATPSLAMGPVTATLFLSDSASA